jgi:hypothetical protein
VISQLEDLTDPELVEKIKSDNEVSGCLEILQHRHSGIFHQKTDKFSQILEVRDLKENPLTFFYEVATSYNPSKAKFSTWLGKKAYWKCLGYQKHHFEGEEIQEWNASEMPRLGRNEIYQYVKEHIKDEEDRKILIWSMEGYTLSEIADKLGNHYTIEWIRVKKRRVLRRFRQILGDEIK